MAINTINLAERPPSSKFPLYPCPLRFTREHVHGTKPIKQVFFNPHNTNRVNNKGQKGVINNREISAPCTHLYELDDVRVPQRAVVDDLAVHILVDLRRNQADLISTQRNQHHRIRAPAEPTQIQTPESRRAERARPGPGGRAR